MKRLTALVFLCFSFYSKAQYFYKDLIGTKETADLIKTYRANKVSHVVLNSYDADNTKNDDFFVEQFFSAPNQSLRTITRSNVVGASTLTSYADTAGNITRTVDSSENSISNTIYNYNDAGLLASVVSSSKDTSGRFSETEEHRWEYANGKPIRMLRIKDKRDTTYVSFKTDEKGNIIEEQSQRKGVRSEPVQYYYDANNRLTDIVRFNTKAKRLLPEYMFEYSPANQVIQKITVPANSSNYLIWRYQYDTRGLKIREAIYDKQKQLNGKIEYQYQF